MAIPDAELRELRAVIATRVRDLRRERHWTQVELSRRLGLSQSRLSEIERGDGSFTAEQLLLILKLFNVGMAHFVPRHHDQNAELQNVLARLGALHLQESAELVPTERLERITDVVRETLIGAESPRLLAALAPVLVRNADRINLNKLHLEFAAAGLERRLGWLLDNTVEALRTELAHAPPRPWAQLYRRAEILLSTFVEFLASTSRSQPVAAPDVLDTNIRSRRSLEEVVASSSPVARRWGVITNLHPRDFVEALRGARAAD
ncbi:MAG TPA: helix-turn-helix transcriptional regulator [Polyangia bacterium]|jgi:transcriptional regulator with XRE-family HTH domain